MHGQHNVKKMEKYNILKTVTSIFLKFLRPTNALIYTCKMLKHTVKISRASEQNLYDMNPLYVIADTSRIPIHAP
jgi:hypothetical protein